MSEDDKDKEIKKLKDELLNAQIKLGDTFASSAIVGIILSGQRKDPEEMAILAYRVAGQMILARERIYGQRKAEQEGVEETNDEPE